MLDRHNEDKAKQGKRAPDGIRLSLLEENRVNRRKSGQLEDERYSLIVMKSEAFLKLKNY